jgi:hypothetical protein
MTDTLAIDRIAITGDFQHSNRRKTALWKPVAALASVAGSYMSPTLEFTATQLVKPAF